jgi:3-oxocholest-4-en-26-oyl-CoA dehydrogenase alpha subunit
MDFSRVDLSEDERAFSAEVGAFLSGHVTEEVLVRERETGDGFNERLHLAIGARGWLAAEIDTEEEGGFTAVQRRLWHLEQRRFGVPGETWGGTVLILQAVRGYGTPELRDEVLPGVFRGELRFCLGYTEPEGGSDIATCKTRAVRDGDGWIINGAKMFTTGAHNCQYVFLLTNTDPAGPRHRNLTMFLVPLNSAGIQIHGLRTVDGERTNIVYYSDVRVADKYRLGDVNGGWAVLNGPLAAEHGARGPDPHGLADVSILGTHGMVMAESVDKVVAAAAAEGADGRRRLDDQSVGYRLGRSYARMEAALSTPGIFGRVAIAQAIRDIAADLMEVLGAGAELPFGAHGSIADSAADYLYRWAPLTGIYGGTVDVFRNMIARHTLGLPRPIYAPPKGETTS